MNSRAFGLSLVMGAVAVLFMWTYVTSREEAIKKDFGNSMLVVKAKNKIAEMETINETMLTFDLVPQRFLEPSAIFFAPVDDELELQSEKIRAFKALIGTVAMVPISKGEQVTLSKITQPGVRSGLAPQVAPGRRAVAISVSDTTGVARLVKPGDRVDLIAVIDVGGGKDSKLVKTLFQDIVVLAAGRAVTSNVPRTIETDPVNGREKIRSLVDDTNFNTVTLEVEPAQAQTLALLLANGETSLSLSLRNNDDTERVPLQSMLIYDVLGPDAARLRAPAARR